MLKQGTISILFGCHSVVHSYLVLLSWIKLYKSFPKFYELVCIFLHDVGHIGLNYLDSAEEKNKHWKLGARIAKLLFEDKGFKLIAGHDNSSGYERSKLYYPDKYSFYICPVWYLYVHCIFEPKLYDNRGMTKHINDFRKKVKESIESGSFKQTHDFYLERKEGEDC